jgi:hypothetical protein
MEMHLFNAAKLMRMERLYKAFFINLKIPIHLLTTDKLDEKGLKHVSLLFRNFKLHNKDTLSLCQGEQSRSRADQPISQKCSSVDFGLQNSMETASVSNSIAPSSTASPQPGSRESRCCQMDYSLYDVDGGMIDNFSSINRFTLHYYQNGDLDVVAEQGADSASIDIYFMLALKKITVAEQSHRETLSEAVVKAIISRLRTAFHGPLQKLIHTSALKLNGPLIFNAVSRSLASALSARKTGGYLARSLDQMAALLPADTVADCLRRRLPHLMELLPAQADRKLLLLKAGDCDLVFDLRQGRLADVLANPLEDKSPSKADLEALLAKAFTLLMGSLWADLN